MDDNNQNQDQTNNPAPSDQNPVSQSQPEASQPAADEAQTPPEEIAQPEITAEPEQQVESVTEQPTEATPAEETPAETTEQPQPAEVAAPAEESAQPAEAATAEQPSETPAKEEPASDEQPAPAPAPKKNENPNAKWYVVHTYSGHENKVAAALKQRIESEGLEKKILEILVPTQDKIEIRSGKKATVKEKVFPGYILVKMELEDTSWLAVRTTQGVTSFVGIGNKPTPISDAEVATIVKFTQEEAPSYKQVFSVSDTVKIVDGPFAEFIGKVDAVDEEKGKIRVLVSIFGRETPVELDFLQVQKI